MNNPARLAATLTFASSILLPLTVTSHISAQTAPQAETFVRTLYKTYDSKTHSGPDIIGPGAAAIFTPPLLALIRRDVRAHKGEVGKMDYDPICSCQDPDGLKLKSLHIQSDAAGKASASVRLNFPGESSPIDLTLCLIWLPQGWRIDDIECKETPSLKKYLQ